MTNLLARLPARSKSPIVRRQSTILLSLLLALAQTGSTQQRPAQRGPDPVTVRAFSNLVVVDVTVRDRKGNVISDLQKEDFKVFEDNLVQEIVTFELESIPSAIPETLAESAPEAPKPPVVNLSATPRAEVKKEVFQDKRLMILFFDLSSLGDEDLIRAVSTAQEFVTGKSTPHDLIAVVTYSSTLEMVQDLTNDRELLIKTLKQLNPDEAGAAEADELGDTESSEEVFVPDDVQFNIFNTDRRLSALENLAKYYREYPERKSLIYFSSGMNTTGIENQSQIRSTVDVANQSNMSIYTVDTRGLIALPPGGGVSRGSPGGRALFTGDAITRQTASLSRSQETLTTLAQDTGGTAFQETNELQPVFDKVLQDTQTYYVLGYYSSNTREDGRFRKIRIEVSRPDLKIQHRPGYFASKQFSKLTESERERQLEEAFNVDRPFSDLPFILQADYFRDAGPACNVPLSLQLAGDGVEFEIKGDRRIAQVEFLARIIDPKGRVAAVARDNVQVRLPVQKAERIRSGQIIYNTGFELRPGDYKLKFLMRDNRTGKLGSFEQDLQVPALDAKSLQTSSVVLGSRLVDAKSGNEGVQHRGFGERFRMSQERRDPLIIDDRRIIPSIGNVFLNRQTVYVYFQVYGAASNPETKKPDLETHLVFLQNKTKLLESQPHVVKDWAQPGTATVTMSVPLASLKKGAYTLQIHVRDNASDTNLFRRIPVVVK